MLFRIAALALSIGATTLPASAAGYPDHTIKMIVPFAAGGGTDVLARIIAQSLNSKWGQPVVVENQPGASGAIGTRAVMKAVPDGYTLLMASTGALMTVSGSADGDGPFDVNKVLSPIVIGAAPPYLLVVRPTLPVNSTADLIRLAKEKPEGLSFGSSGVGAVFASVRVIIRKRDRDKNAARSLQGIGVRARKVKQGEASCSNLLPAL